jgi:hypothetical protein
MISFLVLRMALLLKKAHLHSSLYHSTIDALPATRTDIGRSRRAHPNLKGYNPFYIRRHRCGNFDKKFQNFWIFLKKAGLGRMTLLRDPPSRKASIFAKATMDKIEDNSYEGQAGPFN